MKTVLVALLAGWTTLASAQQGVVGGQVKDEVSGNPIVGARVAAVGTAIVAQTNAAGRYVLAGIPPGQATLRVTAIGYGAVTHVVTLAAGEPAVQDFSLKVEPYSLDEIVVTATGEQAKRELGNVINSIRADSLVQTRPIANINDLLSAKAPGVDVLAGNLTGAGARVRIRGTNSLSLNNEPLYIIDGIRMTSDNNSSSIGIGGTNPSRINDINPEDIESIDVVKGPSAAALYGTAASTGVIIIKTKRGRPGVAQWSVYAEQGFITDQNTYPNAYRGWRTTPTASMPTNGVQCILTQVAAGTCTQDSVTSFNLFNDPQTTPNGTGYRNQYGVQVTGGSDQSSYFISGEWENEVGQLRMPQFAEDSLLALRQISEVPFEQLRPNGRRRVSLRANVETHPNSRLDLAISTGFISSTQRFPQTDNNTTGLLSNALGGPGNKDNGRFGYRAFTPNEFFSETVNQDINRFLGSGTANWRPASWLAVRATGGIDYTNRRDTDLCRRDECVDFGTIKLGFKEDNRTNFFSYTLDASGTATFQLTPTLSSRTTVGLQYLKTVFDRNGAFAEDLAPGATTVDAGAIPDVDEVTDISKTFGAFIEEHVGFKDRLFVTGALRVDDNSAFGASFKAVKYPKLSVSYVISEEPFFPRWSWLNSLRLRAAIGASGLQPGTTDALRFFSPAIGRIENADNPVIIFTSLGNAKLKPERAREIEIGGEATLFNSRLNLDLTYYNKRTSDALIARILPPSAGVSVSRFENLGAVVNRGVEILADARIFNRPSFGWALGVSAGYNTNFIASMGDVPPIIGTTTRQIAGYPINGWWQRPYTYADADGNGIITANEITVEDSAKFVGYANPRWEVIYTSGMDLFRKRLRIVALFDHKSGYYQLNGTERIRCESRLNCRGLVDPTAPLWEQARVVALRETPSRTQWGFIEKATFIRLRELAATYDLPQRWARMFSAARMSFTVAGRNVWKGTGWSGMDPEANYFEGATGIVSNFQTAPPPTLWTFRLNVGF
ncbi:MAG TPA: SusC/RagA family TonB-linked outer membrane protein [Gemmatimonadales bacterium]|jgi:TonB-linked SusC/RagA family outer membrane protein|nr:SusC/RagA family TonB-linked outer membrane protein [Gemmatimonadales bacterium]